MASLFQSGSQIQAYKVPLDLWGESQGLEWVAVYQTLGGFILGCNTPYTDVILGVFLNEPVLTDAWNIHKNHYN